MKTSYNWVRGHQDDITENVTDLPIEAQLNIVADRNAGEYQQTHGRFRPIVSLLPSCPAMVMIQGISITSNLFKNLVRGVTEPNYISHMQKKYKWTDFTVQTIAWK